MTYSSNHLPKQERDDQSRHEDAEIEAMLAALERDDYAEIIAGNDNPRPRTSGSLAEVVAEIARMKAAEAAAKARNTVWKRPAPAPGLVTAAEGKAAEVVRREGRPSPSRSSSPTPAPIKSWEDASESERAVYSNRALVTFGRPVAISINFSPKILAAANDNARRVLDYLRRQVLRHLKRAIGSRPCWIKIETTKDRKIHIHGGMALNDNDDPREIERVLAKAGGNYSCQGSKPADVREMWFPDGWAGYCGKDDARTRRHLRDALGLEADARVPLYSATADIRSEGKRLYEEARRQTTQEARQDSPAPVESLTPPAPAEPASAAPEALEERQARRTAPGAPVSERPARRRIGRRGRSSAPTSAELTPGPTAPASESPGLAEGRVSAPAEPASEALEERQARSSAPGAPVSGETRPAAHGSAETSVPAGPEPKLEHRKPASVTSGVAEWYASPRRFGISSPALPRSRGPPHAGSSTGRSSTRTR